MTRKRRRHSADQIVKKLRDADAMLAAGKSVGEVLQSLEISEPTLSRWRAQYGGMKSEEAKRLKQLEDENQRLMSRSAHHRTLEPLVASCFVFRD
jgi:transposase-like protein